MLDVTDQTALVTGCSRDLCPEIDEDLRGAAARNFLTARNKCDLRAACSHLRGAGINASRVAGDAADSNQTSRTGMEMFDRAGQVDILVSNSVTTRGCAAEDYRIEAWDKVLNRTLRRVFRISQYIARGSIIPQRGGRIVMVAPMASLSGMSNGLKAAAYFASKAALADLNRALAAEWGEYGDSKSAARLFLWRASKYMNDRNLAVDGRYSVVGR